MFAWVVSRWNGWDGSLQFSMSFSQPKHSSFSPPRPASETADLISINTNPTRSVVGRLGF